MRMGCMPSCGLRHPRRPAVADQQQQRRMYMRPVLRRDSLQEALDGDGFEVGFVVEPRCVGAERRRKLRRPLLAQDGSAHMNRLRLWEEVFSRVPKRYWLMRPECAWYTTRHDRLSNHRTA